MNLKPKKITKDVLFKSMTQEEYNNQQAWGISAVINLYDCDHQLIKSTKAMEHYIKELCLNIKMKRHGKLIIGRFADGYYEGCSFMQFITTSSITAHFDEQENRAFIDIFSCRFFEAGQAAEFSKNFFKAKSFAVNIIIRK